MSAGSPSSSSSKTSSRTNSTACVDETDSQHSLIDADIANNDLEGNQSSASRTENTTNGTKKGKSTCCNSMGKVIWGTILIMTSIGGFICPPFDMLLWERLNMRPGLPPYDWWASPPDEVKMRVHLFNVTNHERFMDGIDSKINVQEVGPITYLEKLKHHNITFNSNSTLTYTAERFLIYLPEENSIDLNATIIVPNLALLGISSFLHDANYFVRTGFKLLVNSYKSEFFVRRTLHEYLWDYRESLLETSRNLAPGMVPTTNMGILAQIYADFTDEVTVKMGPRWGHENFFKIDKVRGRSHITGYDPDTCPDKLTGSTEGVLYHQHLRKDELLYGLRKTVCKLMPLHYEKEEVVYGVGVYRYNLPENVFDRKNGTDCYASDPPLPDGISDTSKCFYGFPMVASYPHFYTGSPPKDTYVTGLKPDPLRHSTYVSVEPNTGIPVKAVARMQCNLRMYDLSGYYSSDFSKFSNLILPLAWIEYNQEGLPTRVQNLLYFMIIILPPVSNVIFSLTLILGAYLVMKQICCNKLNREALPTILKTKINNLEQNKIFSYENEKFLNRSGHNKR